MTQGEARCQLEDMATQEEALVFQINKCSQEYGHAPQNLLDQLDQQRRHHVRQLMDIMRDLGAWPQIKEVGEKAVTGAWLVAQHAVMMNGVREDIADKMQIAADNQQIPGWQYAFFYDRIQQIQGKPQIYGTQVMMHSDGYPKPYDLWNPESVNERRQKYGLPPLKEAMQQVWQFMKPKTPI